MPPVVQRTYRALGKDELNGKLTSSFKVFCLLVGLLLVAFYWPWLVGQQSYYQADLTYYFEPFSRFVANGYRHGHIPLWNPYLYCGMAQAAVPSPGMFYPPMLLFTGMEFSQAVAAFLTLHQLIAAVGAYLLVASFGWGALAAAVCGFAVGLSGYMFSLTSNYTLVATAAWLPLLVFVIRSIDRTWTRGNVARIFAGSLCMFAMVAAGRPEIFFPGALIVAAYITVTAFGAYREDRMPRPAFAQAGLRILSLIAGCLLALPVLLPALEWMRLSPRSNGLELKWVLMWSANWYDCLGMVAAQPMGDLTILGNKFLNLVASRPNALPYLTSAYVGPVVVTLAIWGLFDRNWRWRWAVVAVLIGTLVMAIGQYTPIAVFICNLSPVFASFRYPVKLLIFPILCLALMAARGASQAIDKEVHMGAQISSAVLWGTSLLLGIVFLLSPHLHLLTAQFPWFTGKIVNFALMQESQELFGKSLAVTGGLGLLMNGNYFAYGTTQLTKQLFAFLTGGTLLLTLMMPSMAYQRHGTIPNFYRRTSPLALKLQQAIKGTGAEKFASRVQPFYHDPLTPGTDFATREKINVQPAFYLNTRELVLPNTNIDYQLPFAFGYEAAEEGFYKKLFAEAITPSSQNRTRDPKMPINDVPLSRFCQMTSVSHALTQSYMGDNPKPCPELDERVFTLVEENKAANYRIYKTRSFAPRAYFARNLKWNVSKEYFEQRIFDHSNVDPLPETFVQGEVVSGIADGADAATTKSSVQFSLDEPERVLLRTSTSSSRLLVLTDRFYPGWIATIDGAPTTLHLVNFFARGVVVPAGAHDVEFIYSPISVWSGFAAAAAVLLFFAASFVLAGSRSRSAPLLRTSPLL